MHFFKEPKKKLFFEICTWVIAVNFLCQNVVWAQGQSSQKLQSIGPQPLGISSQSRDIIGNINFPSGLGKIIDSYRGNNGKTIIHIVDTHADYKVQKNYAEILKHLMKRTGNNSNILLAVEGAVGDIDTSLLKAIPDEDIKHKICSHFLRKGYLTGAEYFSVFTDKNFIFWGVDDKELYLKNYRIFREVQTFRDGMNNYICKINAALDSLSRKILSKTEQKILETIKRYHSYKIAVTDYAEKLANWNSGSNNDYPNLNCLLKVIEIDKHINYKSIEKERIELIEELNRKLDKEDLDELIEKSLYFKARHISALEFYSLLLSKKKGIKGSYPNLTKYQKLLKFYSKIKNKELISELSNLETSVIDALFTDYKHREIARLQYTLILFQNLVDLELTKEGWEYYTKYRDDFIPQNIHKRLLSLRVEDEAIPNPPADGREMKALEDYFNTVVLRDNAFLKNTLNKMENENIDTAILISGGFHTEGIIEKLKEEGISYLVISPSGSGSNYDSPYLSVMMNELTPFEKLITQVGTRLQVALALAKNPLGIAEINKEIITKKLSFWVQMLGIYVNRENLDGIEDKINSLKQRLKDRYRELGASDDEISRLEVPLIIDFNRIKLAGNVLYIPYSVNEKRLTAVFNTEGEIPLVKKIKKGAVLELGTLEDGLNFVILTQEYADIEREISEQIITSPETRGKIEAILIEIANVIGSIDVLNVLCDSAKRAGLFNKLKNVNVPVLEGIDIEKLTIITNIEDVKQFWNRDPLDFINIVIKLKESEISEEVKMNIRSRIEALVKGETRDSGLISKGIGIKHTSGNKRIKEAKKEKMFGAIVQITLSSTEEDYVNIVSEEAGCVEAALKAIEEKGYAELSNTIRSQFNLVAVTPTDNSPLIALTSRDHYLAIHAGLRRRVIYLSKGLYERIKNNPVLLAAAIAHDGYEINEWIKAYNNAVQREGFQGTISQYREKNPKLVGKFHEDAEKIEQYICGSSTIIEGSKLDEVIQEIIALEQISQSVDISGDMEESIKNLLRVYSWDANKFIGAVKEANKRLKIEVNDIVKGLFFDQDLEEMKNIYNRITKKLKRRHKKVLAIGGGTGLRVTLKALGDDYYVISSQCSVDDGGSTYNIVKGLIRRGFGRIPAPGDIVNSLYSGFAAKDKLTDLLDDTGRIALEGDKIAIKGRKPDGVKVETLYTVDKFPELIEALLKRILDNDGIEKTPEFPFFAATMLNLARIAQRGYFDTGIVPLKGASIRNIVEISAANYLEVYGPTEEQLNSQRENVTGGKDKDAVAIDTTEKIEKFQWALKLIGFVAGIYDAEVTVSHREPGTVYAVYEKNVLLIEYKKGQFDKVIIPIERGTQRIDLKKDPTVKVEIERVKDNEFKFRMLKENTPVSKWFRVEEREGRPEETYLHIGKKQYRIASDGTGRYWDSSVQQGDRYKFLTYKSNGSQLNVSVQSRFVVCQTCITENANYSKIIGFGLIDKKDEGHIDEDYYDAKTNTSPRYIDYKPDLMRTLSENETILNTLREGEDIEAIVIGPGSLFTSILPHFMVDGQIDALVDFKERTGNPIVFVINSTIDNETAGYNLCEIIDFVDAFIRRYSKGMYGFEDIFTDVVMNHFDVDIVGEHFNFKRKMSVDECIDKIMKYPWLVEKLNLNTIKIIINRFSKVSHISEDTMPRINKYVWALQNEKIKIDLKKFITKELKELMNKSEEEIGVGEMRTEKGKESKEAKKARGRVSPTVIEGGEIIHFAPKLKSKYPNVNFREVRSLIGLEEKSAREAGAKPELVIGHDVTYLRATLRDILRKRAEKVVPDVNENFMKKLLFREAIENLPGIEGVIISGKRQMGITEKDAIRMAREFYRERLKDKYPNINDRDWEKIRIYFVPEDTKDIPAGFKGLLFVSHRFWQHFYAERDKKGNPCIYVPEKLMGSIPKGSQDIYLAGVILQYLYILNKHGYSIAKNIKEYFYTKNNIKELLSFTDGTTMDFLSEYKGELSEPIALWNMAFGRLPKDESRELRLFLKRDNGEVMKFSIKIPKEKWLKKDPYIRNVVFRYLNIYLYNRILGFGAKEALIDVDGKDKDKLGQFTQKLINVLLERFNTKLEKWMHEEYPGRPYAMLNDYLDKVYMTNFELKYGQTEENHPEVQHVTFNKAGVYVGVDISATSVQVVVVKDGEILPNCKKEFLRDMETFEDGEDFLNFIKDKIVKTIKYSRMSESISSVGVGISLAVYNGKVTGSGLLTSGIKRNIDKIINMGEKLEEALKSEFQRDIPVKVLNSTDAGAFWAAQDISELKDRTFFALSMGSGLGGSLIEDGRLMNYLSEIGSIVVDMGSEAPRHPKTNMIGAMRTYLSFSAILRPGGLAEKEGLIIHGGKDKKGLEEFQRLYNEGTEEEKKAVRRVLEKMGIWLAELTVEMNTLYGIKDIVLIGKLAVIKGIDVIKETAEGVLKGKYNNLGIKLYLPNLKKLLYGRAKGAAYFANRTGLEQLKELPKEEEGACIDPTDFMRAIDHVMRMLKIKDYPRIVQIFKTSIDPVALVNELARISDRDADSVSDILRKTPFFSTIALDYRVRVAEMFEQSEYQGRQLDIVVGADGYQLTADIQPETEGEPLSDYISAKRNTAGSVPFVFRDNMELFVGDFLKGVDVLGSEKPDLVKRIQQVLLFFSGIDISEIKYVITSGIGANEMYSHQLAQIVNAHFKGKVKWIVVNNPAHQAVIPDGANNSNTVVFEMSRSGSTQATVDFFNVTKDRFKKRIVAANSGKLKDESLKLKNRQDAVILNIDDIPGDIGGRQMNRKTLMVYVPLFMALVVGTKEAGKAKEFLCEYVRASLESNTSLCYSNGIKSEAVRMAEFLLRQRTGADRTKFAVVYDSSLKATSKELFQLMNEGANKNIAGNTNRNILDSFSLDDREIYDVIFNARPDEQMPIFLLNKNVPSYKKTMMYIRELRQKGIPCIVVAVDLVGKPNLHHNLKVLARTSNLLQDMAVYFTYLTNQDANSNPAVKFVREITAAIFETLHAKKDGGVTDIRITLQDVMKKIAEKRRIDEAKAKKAVNERGAVSEDYKIVFDEFKNSIIALATALGVNAGRLTAVIIETTSRSVVQTDVGEAGGSKIAEIAEAFSRTILAELLGSKSPAVAIEPLQKQIYLTDEVSRVAVSVAVEENNPLRLDKNTLAEKIADYLYSMYTNKRRAERLTYMPLVCMEADQENQIIKDINKNMVDNLADLGVSCPKLALPGVAHTGIEAVMSHSENIFVIAIVSTQANGGVLGNKTVEGRITIDDATYVYGIGNVVRMALGGSPSVIFEIVDANDLEMVKNTIEEALRLFRDRIRSGVLNKGSSDELESLANQVLMELLEWYGEEEISKEMPAEAGVSRKELLNRWIERQPLGVFRTLVDKGMADEDVIRRILGEGEPIDNFIRVIQEYRKAQYTIAEINTITDHEVDVLLTAKREMDKAIVGLDAAAIGKITDALHSGGVLSGVLRNIVNLLEGLHTSAVVVHVQSLYDKDRNRLVPRKDTLDTIANLKKLANAKDKRVMVILASSDNKITREDMLRLGLGGLIVELKDIKGEVTALSLLRAAQNKYKFDSGIIVGGNRYELINRAISELLTKGAVSRSVLIGLMSDMNKWYGVLGDIPTLDEKADEDVENERKALIKT